MHSSRLKRHADRTARSKPHRCCGLFRDQRNDDNSAVDLDTCQRSIRHHLRNRPVKCVSHTALAVITVPVPGLESHSPDRHRNILGTQADAHVFARAVTGNRLHNMRPNLDHGKPALV